MDVYWCRKGSFVWFCVLQTRTEVEQKLILVRYELSLDEPCGTSFQEPGTSPWNICNESWNNNQFMGKKRFFWITFLRGNCLNLIQWNRARLLVCHMLTRLMKTERGAQFVLEAVQREVCLEAVQHNVYTCSYICHPTCRHVAHRRRWHVFTSGGVIAPAQTYALVHFSRKLQQDLVFPEEGSNCGTDRNVQSPGRDVSLRNLCFFAVKSSRLFRESRVNMSTPSTCAAKTRDEWQSWG